MAAGSFSSRAGSSPSNVVTVVVGVGALAAAAAAAVYYYPSIYAAFDRRRRKGKPIRIYMDGCFDMMHYGHANALRQAKTLGDELVVGLIPDSEIIRCKGPPVMTEDERYVSVESVKWVDEVIRDVPYDITQEFLEELFTKHQIDYVIHGDDPCLLPDGTDAYALARKAGRFKQIKRTEGVSTTDIVGRMLLCVRDNNRFLGPNGTPLASSQSTELQRQFSTGKQISHFLPTSRRILQFSNGTAAKDGARIVYLDGAFDLFHAGHVETFKLARKFGDFLLVGIHTDEVVSLHRGLHHPIMALHERTLSVLACRYVDEVIIGAPWAVTQDLITTFNISVVVHGTVNENEPGDDSPDPYGVPKALGIYQEIESPRANLTTLTIINRIIANRSTYQKRNEKKATQEAAYIANKEFVQEI